ncbi:MAG: F0F1 ATP synthase subunit epsilon [Pseudomonadota bacterium]|jgi:F-type H+-transporting ATPase subunit epsilon|nr:F0F1 ATP synthase subunit epsilon [Gammaproteobacteria bacterium]MBU1732966.1 F0F1 ATP synthase subunit epsilon [Gammaproteobacteria bacterium]MBU1892014.1 F0F1 ATP synthase subunit epsilon [Gammaproteobacteria bacterium]
MAMTIHVDVVSAEQSIYSGVAEFVAAPAEGGEVGIYPRHAPLISRMKPGTVRIKVPDREEEELFFVSGGILEIQPQVVTILADTALRGKDLDEAKALDAKRLAEEALKDRSALMDYAKAEAELAEAVAQIRAIDQLRKISRH